MDTRGHLRNAAVWTPLLPCSGVTARARVCMPRRMWHPVDRMQSARSDLCVAYGALCLGVSVCASLGTAWTLMGGYPRDKTYRGCNLYMTAKVAAANPPVFICACVFLCVMETRQSLWHNTYRHNCGMSLVESFFGENVLLEFDAFD